MADESIDSLVYYCQLIDSAKTKGDGEVVRNGYENLLRIYKSSHEDISQDTTYAHILSDYAWDLCLTLWPRWNLEKAIELSTEATSIYKAFEGNGLLYAESLEKLSFPYSLRDNNEEAIRLIEEAIEIKKRLLGPENLDYAQSLANLAGEYHRIGNDNEAIRLGNEVLKIYKKINSDNNLEYVKRLRRLYHFYFQPIRISSEKIRLISEIMEMIKRLKGNDNPDYVDFLIFLSSEYTDIGNHDKAKQSCDEALNIYKSISDTLNTYDSYSILDRLASCYSNLGDNNEAIRLETEAMEKARLISNQYYDFSLTSLADYYYKNGNPNEAINFMEKSVAISWFGASVLAKYYSSIGNYNEAIRIESEALEQSKKYYGSSLFLEDFYIHLVEFYSKAGRYDEAIPILYEFMPIMRKTVFSRFMMQTASQRDDYWNPFNHLLNSEVPLVLMHTETPDKASMLYDNTALLTKGLLLSTEIEMNKLIQESDDSKVLQMFSELQKDRQILNIQYSKPIAQRTIDCDSLERASERIEHLLVSRVNEFGDYTRNLSITWQDVKSKLGDNDIAIEFLSYSELDSITTYVALTLCKNDTAPMLTPLFTEIELSEAIDSNDTFLNEKTDSLIWGAFSSRLANKSHVYFSASGMLHSIGIEYLPSMEGKDCHRLSSTRELVTHKPSQTISSATTATIFGGINYYATYDSIESSAPKYVKDYIAMNTVRGRHKERFDYRSLQRYGVGPLPGSHAELKEIFTMLNTLNANCDTLSGTQASEESFKALSGQRKSLLHISTHGIYHTPDEVENLNCHLQRMLIGNDRPTHYEDQSLLRCWLCFAGANLAICDTLPDESRPTTGQDDGILSALEIAQTDLRGLDLVVLSACQTALGDISLGEGVFGLQRGFKKAGAQSILMSLWDVDDKITQLLMTEFYRGWISGMTKTEALRNAQSIVKAKYPNPRHWATFILLDAFD